MWRPDALAGRTVVVTGAARGIGKAVSEAFLAAGAKVWVHGRMPGPIDALCSELGSAHGGAVEPVCFDMSDPQEIKRGFALVQKGGKLDVLVNNAGILREALVEMTSVTTMDELYAVNMRGVMVSCQYAARLMGRAGGGSIVNISSIMGRVGRSGQVAYSATKAGVIGATLSLAKELGPKGIRVNAVAPGVIDTELLAKVTNNERQALVSATSLGRIGNPQDVAGLCVFLASDTASFITGQVIGVDGGLVA